jgi:hypothetical protein
MKDHIWSLDCIAICAVLGFTMDDKQITKLCRKHGLHKGEGPLDKFYGFYLLHRSCHDKGGALAKQLTKTLDERFAGIIRTVRRTKCGPEVQMGNDEEIAKKLDKWIRQCPAGVMWALLTDTRDRFHQYGVYLVHRIAYTAFRDAHRKSTGTDKQANALAAVQSDLQSSRKRLTQQTKEMEGLREQLAAAEEKATALQATCRQQQQRITRLKDMPSREAKLRRQIRMLEHELEDLREQDRCAASGVVDVPAEGIQAVEPTSPASATDPAGICAESEQARTTEAASPCCRSCPLESLRVAVVGGLDRLEAHYRQVVEDLGARFYFHNGDCHGTCDVLQNVICQSDIIVFLTRVNSHAALQVVRGLCRKRGKQFTAIRETSPHALARYLRQSGGDFQRAREQSPVGAGERA